MKKKAVIGGAWCLSNTEGLVMIPLALCTVRKKKTEKQRERKAEGKNDRERKREAKDKEKIHREHRTI